MRQFSRLTPIFLLLLMFSLQACFAVDTVENVMEDAMATPIPPTPTITAIPATPTIVPNSTAGFEQFLAEITAANLSDRVWLISSWLTNEPTTPLTDQQSAIFFYEGRGNAVALRGDMNNWGNDGDTPLEHISGTNFWWHQAEYEPNARLDYMLVVDGVEQLDERNPSRVDTAFGTRSVLMMPAYEAFLAANELSAPTSYGTLHNHLLESKVLSQTRSFVVYEPPFTVVGEPIYSLYLHDGGDYLSIANLKQQLDALIDQKVIRPLTVVFIPPVDRRAEYNNNRAYQRFVAEELVPFVQENYSTDRDPAYTGTMGVSLGGLVAMRLGLEYPNVFGLIGAQSGAFGLGNENVIEMIDTTRNIDKMRVHLIVGTYETAVYPNAQGIGSAEEGDFLDATRRLSDALADNGVEYAYNEYPEGHSWGLWTAHVRDALQFFYE